MSDSAIQDLYPEDTSHCYGCGYGNADGLQLKSYWDGQRSVARFTPDARYTAIPGFVYGGLLASLIDCHGTATAAAAAAGGPLAAGRLPRFVTASLAVDYRRPTPLGVELELTGRALEVGERKVVVDIELAAGGQTCVTGRVVAVRLPASMQGG